jgi:Rrf2 family protein
MLITKESDYAVRIIRELSGGGRETVQDICGKEQIPQPYGYKILKKLEKGGLVKGFRGAKGGYSLMRAPDTITLFDVFTAVDGNLLLTECVDHRIECPMNSGGRCRVHREFLRLQELLLQGLKERPLTEIL